MELITNQTFSQERALYAARDLVLENCAFEGEEDGESALKEARRISVKNSLFRLRYPFWHDAQLEIGNCTMTETCRAALWYCENVRIDSSRLGGIKALRECADVVIAKSEIESAEFGWKSRRVTMEDCALEGEYPFFGARDLVWKNCRLKGKYSFQYVENAVLENSVLDTKDAFWHTKNVTAKNCVIRGEYLGWYAENLVLENCTITGTQPLCYAKGLVLINCTMEGADLAFEYSDVQAELKGTVDSVKNPRSGRITADRIGERILTPDSVYPCRCEIVERAK